MKKQDTTEKIEQTVISCLMLFKEDQDKIPTISQDWFYNHKYREVFRCMNLLHEKGEVIDIIILSRNINTQILQKHELAEITNLIPGRGNIDNYIFRLRNEWMTRSLTAFFQRSLIKLAQPGAQAIDTVVEIEEKSKELISNSGAKFQELAELAPSVMAEIEMVAQRAAKGEASAAGISSGLMKFDSNTGGLQNSDLIIMAARPAMGKTSLMMTMAINAARTMPVGIFSLEMSARQLTKRIFSMQSGVSVMDMNSGKIEANQFKALNYALDGLNSYQVVIDDSASLKLAEIAYKARIMKKENSIKILFIDYLQLISNKSKGGSREQEISSIARGLKNLAKELDIPVVALSQLSRAVEQRGDKKPILSDLRDSGDIEAAADMVLMLYRASYYFNEEPEDEASIIIAKFRNGVTAELKMGWDGTRTLWTDPAQDIVFF